MPKCVLVLAQQTALRATIARVLVPLRYRVEIASSEKIARRLVAKEHFDAAVVAPASLGSGELALLREMQSAAGKLVLLADDSGACKRLAGAFPGALVCPSQPLELEKIVTFVAGTTLDGATNEAADAAGRLHFAGCTLDVPGRIFLDANRQEVALTRREFALLFAFVRNPGRALSRAQLRNAIDGGSADADDRSIDMMVARVRRKIEPDAAKAQFIVTVPGTGYKFVPRVREVELATVPSPALRSPDREDDSERDGQRAERRQLTVLSCQILGFAALAAKLDPEDLDNVIGRVYAACAEIIECFGGTMVRSTGDNVLAYFGFPTAHENDAENAVRAALALVRAVGGIEAAPIGRFHARIGIATGLMLVRDVSYSGSKEPTAIGEAPNLALHMQNAAPAGSVVIGSRTREFVGRLFDCRELKPIVLEQGGAPAPVWRVFEEIAGTPRFDALRRDGMSKIVGREAELEQVSRFWSAVRRGSGQVVLVSGEAGIGKSRLVVEFKDQFLREPHARIPFFGSPHRSEAPMAALFDAVQNAAGFAADDTATQKVDKLQKAFAAIGAAAVAATALVAALLGLPCEAPQEFKELSPQKRKERTFAVLLQAIEATAAQQPLLIAVEDAQWVDPASLEFLTLLVERASSLRLLLLVVGRPEFAPPWPDHSYVTTLTLSRLSPADSAALIHQVAGDRRVPAAIEAEIVSRADGVPLFVEELTKSVLERNADGGDRTREAVGADAAQAIPTTLHGLLLARFDRLDRGKEAAQAAAVIGREFSFELLRMIAGVDESALASALDQLVTSGLVFRRGSPPHATFVFKHALVRDAAYGMLLRERRRILHASVVRAIEDNFPETVKAQPELLAYHHREAGDPAKAGQYLLTAAERALQRSATTEALSHLAQTRELISGVPESRDRLQLRLTLEITSARALLATRGYTAPETREAYRRAHEYCEALGDQSSLPLIIHGRWLGAWIAADHQSALEQARQLYLWGERNHDEVGLAVAHTNFGMTLTTLGQLVEARRHLDQALEINRFVLPGRQPFVASDVDGRISALSFMHNCLLLLGFPDKAEALANEAASLNPQNLYSRALAQVRMMRMRVFGRDALTLAEIGPGVLRLAQQQGYPYLMATAMIYTGWALAQYGEVAEGVAYCERGLAQLQTMGGKCWLPLSLALLAECHQQAGHPDRSAAALAQALESVEATDERIWEAEIYRLKGKLLLNGGDTDAAGACFATALNKAKARQAKLLQLRAAVSLAELLIREHKSRQAREVLAPVYCSFTEGFDGLDLREAKALLDNNDVTP